LGLVGGVFLDSGIQTFEPRTQALHQAWNKAHLEKSSTDGKDIVIAAKHKKIKAPLYVISGASGSGKTTICRRIAKTQKWYYSVSHTTRPKRDNEKEGRDYYFVTRFDFLKMIDASDFLEWAEVYGHLYGTSKKIIEDKLSEGQGVILDVDTQGASAIKNIFPQAVLIFVDTRDIGELETRLKNRATDSAPEIKRRVEYAEHEIGQKSKYDHVILNDDLDQALERVESIIINQKA
jgi:guanylate kinase